MREKVNVVYTFYFIYMHEGKCKKKIGTKSGNDFKSPPLFERTSLMRCDGLRHLSNTKPIQVTNNVVYVYIHM